MTWGTTLTATFQLSFLLHTPRGPIFHIVTEKDILGYYCNNYQVSIKINIGDRLLKNWWSSSKS
jgi:hypothetical protein